MHLTSFAIQFISTPLQPDLTIWLIKNLLKSKEAEMLNKHTVQSGLSYNTVDVVVTHMKIHANVATRLSKST